MDLVKYELEKEEPKNQAVVSIQQIDASEFPTVKLYMSIKDKTTGNVIENLDDAFFYINKQDANAKYVKQVVKSANQLKSKAGHISPLTDAIKPTTILNGTGTTLTELTSMPNVIKVASILSKVTTKVGQTTTEVITKMGTLTTSCMLT